MHPVLDCLHMILTHILANHVAELAVVEGRGYANNVAFLMLLIQLDVANLLFVEDATVDHRHWRNAKQREPLDGVIPGQTVVLVVPHGEPHEIRRKSIVPDRLTWFWLSTLRA